jgi:hypothetical protein
MVEICSGTSSVVCIHLYHSGTQMENKEIEIASTHFREETQ